MGVERTILQFSHANGFPAECYRAFLAALDTHFDVRYVPQFGHDPRHPVTDGWHHLVDELVTAVAAHGHPVVAVGHSLGGYLSLMAAARRPDLFRRVVMLDAPILSRLQGGAIAFTKRIGVFDRFTPAPGTRSRRRHWSSRDEALQYFRAKPVFRGFDPRCMADYVTYGTTEDASGVRLRFDPEIEYHIYRTMPHDMVRDASRLTVPAGLILGAQSDIVRRIGTRTSERRFRMARTAGGHLFPFQHPETAANAVFRMMSDLATAGA
ncbi:MAG: alpha/beta fold hydrolase [Betaproteobacteria bacterium]|nr:alpha/beta fold hydrolase [Betaproteobacteria bacterium]